MNNHEKGVATRRAAFDVTLGPPVEVRTSVPTFFSVAYSVGEPSPPKKGSKRAPSWGDLEQVRGIAPRPSGVDSVSTFLPRRQRWFGGGGASGPSRAQFLFFLNIKPRGG